MLGDLLLILDDDLPEETILLPQSVIRTATALHGDLLVSASPDDAVYCSSDIYDLLEKMNPLATWGVSLN